MTKTLKTKKVERVLWRFTHKLGVYGCFEVTLGLGMTHDHREIVDYITYDKTGVIRCYEIKTSYADYLSSARKSWWGNYNYLVTVPGVWDEIKSHEHKFGGTGVYVVDDNRCYSVHKGSKHQLSVGEQVTILESMVRSMDREEQKLYKNGGY